MKLKLFNYVFLLPLFLILFLASTVKSYASTDFFLHGTGPNNNPPTLFLDNNFPVGATEKFKDSPGVNYSGGNLWKEVGTWPAFPADTNGNLTTLGDAQVWLGLKNSDDMGTSFDLKVDVLKNGNVIATGEKLCITGLKRNQNLAQEVLTTLESFTPQSFNGTTDLLSLKISTRIGTNPDGSKCPGHNNAAGLRLYFDSTNRPSRLSITITPVVNEPNRAYVTSGDSNHVSVINTDTDSVVATIPVGPLPIGVVYHPQSNRSYVANTFGNTVSIIDTITNLITATVAVSPRPYTVAANPNLNRVYVAGTDTDLAGTMDVIDTASNAVVSTVTAGLSAPLDSAISPDGSRVYIVNSNCCPTTSKGFVSVYDSSSYSLLKSIEVNMGPAAIVLTPDGSKAYVANDGGETQGHTVSVIDTNTNSVVDTIDVGINPHDIAINSAGTRVYVTSTFYWVGGSTGSVPGEISVINTATNEVIDSFTVGYIPDALAVSSDDQKLYVLDSQIFGQRDIVSVYDLSNNTLAATIFVGSDARFISTKP